MELILHFEGFYDSQESFTVKELAYSDGTSQGVFVFKPPFPWKMLTEKEKRTAVWASDYYHGLSWYEREIPYSYFPWILHMLTEPFSVIWVRGETKRRFLEKWLQISISSILGQKILKYNKCVVCPNHTNGFSHCALQKVIWYHDYLKAQKSGK
ncbi:hypothetical protein X975_00604, partial [Stegodyphus mimosarum]